MQGVRMVDSSTLQSTRAAYNEIVTGWLAYSNSDLSCQAGRHEQEDRMESLTRCQRR